MTWKIDDDRVMPFLSADERRDVEAVLCRMPVTGLVFREEGTAAGTATTPGPQAGKFKDFKDGKDSKENKDYKDSKDHKDAEFVLVSVCENRQFADPGSDLGVDIGIEVADADDDVVTVLRMSRVNRYLRRAGLVI